MTRLYDPDRLYEEVAFVAYHFGWGHDEVLAMPHWERQQWCEQISEINDRMNEDTSQRRGRQRTESGGAVLRNPIDSV